MTTEPDRAPLSTEVSRLENEVGPHAHHPLMHFRLIKHFKAQLPEEFARKRSDH